ncbi:hypothetical protein ACMGE6_05775 [Macrococcus equi]|uniref:TcaA NTF2-like domain-containing protein n=1 Tax=Macrococcus equi TaxID=3395462 RepID=UPI0039BDDA0E
MRMYKIVLAVLLSLVLGACNNGSNDVKEDTKSSETSKVKSEEPTAKSKSEKATEKPKTVNKTKSKKDKTSKKKHTTEVSANLKLLTDKALNDYLSVLPNAMNNRNYSKIRPFIKSGSKAEEYFLAKLPTGSFDNYRITAYNIDRIDVKGRYAHAIVTRTMSSNATNGNLKRVITVFDYYYNKQTRKMELYDFNDKAIYDVETNAVPEPTAKTTPASTPQQAKGDATTCIQTRLTSSCEGVSDSQLLNAYNAMVQAGTLPKAAYNGCVTCTIKSAYQIKDNPVETAKVNSLPQAVQMTTDQYRKQLEAYYSDMDIAIIGAQPINGTDILEDAGGKYYKVKAIDINTKELLQTYKVYISSGTIVAE